jgi:oxygen-dependent protoporphyrinogen oxidase
VTKISRAAEPARRFQVELASGERIAASHVVVALPAHEAAPLIASNNPALAEMLSGFRTNPAGSVSLAFQSESIARPLPGYGLLVPVKENRPINAITVASRKFTGRAPEGWTLLRVFFGGARSPGTMTLNDDELMSVVLDQLGALLGAASPPLFHRIVRWPSGSPQYDLGHLDRVAGAELLLPDGMHLAGCSYRGVGLPDLANEALWLADRLAQ